MVGATLKDDVELASLFMEVTPAQDGGNWKDSHSRDVSGTEQKINETFLVPGNVNDGHYYIDFRLLDKKGNLTETSSSHFEVINNQKPSIDVSIGSVEAGDTMKISGTVTDNKDVAHVSVRIKIPPGYSGDPTYYQEQFDLDGPSDTLWDFQKDGAVKVYFPPFAKTGKYSLQISAADNEGNYANILSSIEI